MTCLLVFFAFFLCIALPFPAFALNLSVGGGVFASTSPYKRYDGGIKPYPLINFNSEYFYIRGFTGGFKVINAGMHEVSLIASYLPWEFDPDDTTDSRMRRLDKRHSTVMAGGAYRLTTPYGVFGVSLQADVLGNSNGLLGDVSYSYPFNIMPKVNLSPAVGLRWDSENQVDYYFGVDHGESRHSGVREYSPHDAVSPYAKLGANVNIYKNFSVYAEGQVLMLSDEIQDSPMVDDSAIWSGGAGLRLDF